MNRIDPFLIHQKVAPAAARACQPICKRYNINQTGFEVLMFLANHREYNTARDLCTVRSIKPGLASVTVDSLIRRGFLKRQEDPEDRRVKRLFLTEEAGPLVEEGGALQREFWRAVTAGIPEEELRAFWRTAEKMVANITDLSRKGIQDD